jgi:hypothetical protein
VTEEAVQTEETTADAVQQTPSEEEKVPVSHIAKVRKENKALEARLRKYEEREAERERAALSETERLQQERDEARSTAQALEKRIINAERSALVRAAAAKAKFADPEDAVAFADLSDIDDRAAAERHVKSLANRKPHLLIQEQAPAELQRVLRDGLPTDSSQAGTAPDTEQALRAAQGREILELAQAARARTQR